MQPQQPFREAPTTFQRSFWIVRPQVAHYNMASLPQDIDDLDRMVDTGAQKDAIRSQIRLIGREVAALEADYSRLAEDHEKLKAAQAIPSPAAPSDGFEFRRGLYYKAGDPIPFCPHCWEASSRRIHLSGPIEMMNREIEYWECHTCDKDYDAKADENFRARPARPGRRHH